MAIIYGLYDPRDGRLRYIGVTSVPMSRRLWGHIDAAKKGCGTPKARWARKLLDEGLKPAVHIIERDAHRDREAYWISSLRAARVKLLNLTDGGDGTPGYRHPAEFIEALVSRNKGRTVSMETRAAISASLTGKPLGDARRAKLRGLQKGKKKPDGFAEAVGNRWRGVPKTDAQKAKQSATMKAMNARKRAERDAVRKG